MKPNGTIALVSGGADSLLLVRALLVRGRRVWPLYVRCGLRWEVAELACVRRWLRAIRHPRLMPLHVAVLPLGGVYNGHWSRTGRRVPSARSTDAAVYLPGRNVFLLAQGALEAVARGASEVALGTLANNPFGDATPKFFTQMGACLQQALRAPMRIIAPLRRLTKAQAIAMWKTEPFVLTLSCLQPRGLRHCGRCNKCAERRRAFRRAGLDDPTRYASAR